MKHLTANEIHRFNEVLIESHALTLSAAPQDLVIPVVSSPSCQYLCSTLQNPQDAFPVPFLTKQPSAIPPNTQFVLAYNEGVYRVYFCLSHNNQHCSMEGDPEGIRLHITNQTPNTAQPVLVCVQGKKLLAAMERAMALALDETGNHGTLSYRKPPLLSWLHYLGWDSGACYGKEVSHDKILASVKSLIAAGYPPGYVVIDEGWQQLDSTRTMLASFDADSIRFPKGLKGLVTELNALGIHHIGVWHGMVGYREGIHPDLATQYDLPSDQKGRHFLGVDLGRTFQFFLAYYRYLYEQGVIFIKVGDQGNPKTYEHNPTLNKNLQQAIQAAASVQFNSAHFNTDCLRNENLFYWITSRIARAAENIDMTKTSSVFQMIHTSLTNSLWLQYLMYPDFDVWMTSTPRSEMLAIFHALSGSINVLSDPPKQHTTSLLRKIILPGKHIIRADYPLTLCSDSVFCNPLEEKKIYKAFTRFQEHGIIGIFNLNLSRKTLHGTISPSDVENLEGELFAVYSHEHGFCGTVRADESLPLSLKPNQADVITFTPIVKGTAVIGSYLFYIAPGPITDVTPESESLHITSEVISPIIAYCEHPILEVRCNGKTIPWEYDERRKILSIDSRSHIVSEPAHYTITYV